MLFLAILLTIANSTSVRDPMEQLVKNSARQQELCTILPGKWQKLEVLIVQGIDIAFWAVDQWRMPWFEDDLDKKEGEVQGKCSKDEGGHQTVKIPYLGRGRYIDRMNPSRRVLFSRRNPHHYSRTQASLRARKDWGICHES